MEDMQKTFLSHITLMKLLWNKWRMKAGDFQIISQPLLEPGSVKTVLMVKPC